MKQASNTISDYQQQAIDFATKYNVKLSIGSPDYGKMGWDKKEDCRYIFPCRLSRNGKSYSFKFGQSIASGSEEPTIYDILACMTKYDPGTFENFCADFGYDSDSRTAEKTYKAVCKEWEAIDRLFNDCLEELAEIA